MINYRLYSGCVEHLEVWGPDVGGGGRGRKMHGEGVQGMVGERRVLPVTREKNN